MEEIYSDKIYVKFTREELEEMLEGKEFTGYKTKVGMILEKK